ncbi:MAG TPA: ATP-binding protein [Steroidobacteraceae bacterium]|nr:ATP-binding protein [Steroidobacteraceae bacterium]
MQDTTPAALSAGADVVGILDSIDIPIVGIGLDCRVTRFNPAAAEILGIRPSDIGRRTCNLQALAELPDIWHMCVQVMADGVPSRHDLRNGDRWFLLRISPCKEPDGRVRGAVLTFTNVTAFRASVGQAVYEREYTKTILNTVIDPLVVLGSGLRVQTGNRAFYDWFGASREQTQGVALSDLGDGDWKASGLWPSLEETLSHDREFRTVELEASFPSKGLRTVLLDARRLARDGTALVLLAFRDITERKTLDHLRELLLAREEALRKDAQAAASALAQTREALRKRVAELAAADRHKNEFLAILAHELRNPLAPLRNAVQILHRFPGDAVVTAKARDLIDRQVHHMSRLVSDLLEAARAQHGQIKLQTSSLDLRSSIEHVVDLIRPPFDAKHQTLRVTLPEAPVWVQGDATRLEQVFTNLLSNANKYTGERGAVEISLESCLSDASTRWAVVRVVDNGQGIDADLVPRLFQLFTQADRSLAHSQGGLGIGLSLVRTLVELHGGRVSVRSGGRDRGSTFEVRIPMRPAPLGGETSAPALASVEPVARRRRVLVVEDNQDIRESSCELLEMAGFEVMGVSTGPEALEQAPVFGPHVLLLDVGLPGLSGYDVARRLRAMPQFASTLLVAITGYDTPEARERSAVAGFDHHICKPVNFDELARLLN